MDKHTDSLESKIFYLRKQIDYIDNTILDLINTRLYLAASIGYLKREKYLCVVDNIREAQILSRLKSLNNGLLGSGFLCDIFSDIMAASRAIQKEDSYLDHKYDGLFSLCLSSHISNNSNFATPHCRLDLVYINTTIIVDCSYFFDFVLTSKNGIYVGYRSQTKYRLAISISNSGILYIYLDLCRQHNNWSQRCIFVR